ncbi:MAG: hypothetical protein DDT30_01932 [Dehalococcoidia bacterium]|nr:hypothetical protein [Bacillota bacterium]
MKLRVEPYTVGDFIHAYNRGNRKMAIVKDINDKWRFLKILRFYNDKFVPVHTGRDLKKLSGSGLSGSDPDSRGKAKIMKILITGGAGTIIGMHISEKHREEAEKVNVNVVIAGHISSDSIGGKFIFR